MTVAAQTWDADRYALHARFVSDLGAPVVNLLRPDLCRADGLWTADYVRLRFSARRPI